MIFHKSTKPKILVNFTDNPTAVEELYSFDIYNIPAIDNQTNFTGSLLTSSKRKPLSFIRVF